MITTKKIKVKLNICNKCGYSWVQKRNKGISNQCPKCKTFAWNEGNQFIKETKETIEKKLTKEELENIKKTQELVNKISGLI